MEKAKPPFKIMMVDGRDWLIVNADQCVLDVRAAFAEYHGRKPSRAAKLFIVPVSYGLTEGGLNYTKKAGDFDAVEVRA